MSSSLSFNPNGNNQLNTNIILSNGCSSNTATTLPSSVANQTASSSSTSKLANPKTNKLIADYKQIILELRAQNFDVIRFATYRTASKLRFIQKKLNLHLIDLWNVIETFRDNNLHTLDLQAEIESNKLEVCIQNMYVELNKRLAYNQHINVENQTQLLTAWLLNLYDKNRLSRIKVISFKIALTTMCAGKLTDKMKFIFNQISDLNKNCLVVQKFELYLKELLTLPTSVFEEPSFGYNENLSKTCFDLSAPIRLNDFLSVVLSDVGPACFIWLNVFHRFTVVQSVTHPVTCNVCQRTNFNGFRYKCQKCRKYQLCQDCFWRGRVSHSHQLTHQMKEYTSYKSAAKQFSNSLKKSFFCKPSKQAQRQQQQQQLDQQQPNFPKHSTYDKRLNLSQISSKTNTLDANSDYHTLMRQSQLLHQQQQQQQINNTESIENVYGMKQNSPIKLRRINTPQHQQTLGAIEDIFAEDQTSNFNKSIQKPIDLAHIITPLQDQHVLQQTQSSNQISNRDKLQSSLKKSSTQPYSNTLSMTRNSKPLNNETNILANFLLAKSSNSSNNIITQDEHSIIANYSSILSDYYQKNPHLSSSPTATANTSSPSQPKSFKLQNRQSTNDYSSSTTNTLNATSKSNKTKSFVINETPSVYYNMFDSSSTVNQNNSYRSTTNQNNKTASLSRHAVTQSSNYPQPNNADYQARPKLNSHYNTNSSYSTTTIVSTAGTASGANTANSSKTLTLPANTTRSLSESNFRLNNNILHTQITSNEDISYQRQPLTSTTLTSINEDKLLKEKREIVAKLEQQNKEIIKEIKRLKLQQLSNRSLDLSEQQKKLLAKNLKENSMTINSKKQLNSTLNNTITNESDQQHGTFSASSTMINPYIIAELQTLKQRKGQLENRMHLLESSRDELIGQLTQLDNVLKQSKPVSTSNPKQRITVTISPKQQHKYATLSQKNSHSSNSKPTQSSIENLSHLQSISLNNIVPDTSTSQTFVPIVSASMAMQMPPTVQQQRSGIITNTSNRRSTNPNANIQPRSWSTPNTPAMYEIHTTRLAQQQQQQHPQVSQATHLTKTATSSLPHSSSSLLSMVAMSSANSSSLTSNTSGFNNNINNNINNNSSTSNLRNLRNDLLIAADSVTNAMQSLVKELNSENEISFNTSSDDDQEEEIQQQANLDSNQYLENGRKSNTRCQSACSIKLNDVTPSSHVNNLNQLNNISNRYPMYNGSVSASVTPVTFRRQLDSANDLKQQLLLINNSRNAINLDNYTNSDFLKEANEYLAEEKNGKHDYEDEEENCLLTESFIDDLNNANALNDPTLIEISNNNKALHLQQQQLQIQFQQQQIHLQQQQNQLIADLTSNNNEQVASWRRELEQRLIDDNDNNLMNANNSFNNDNNKNIGNINNNQLIEQQFDEDKKQ